MIKCHAQLCALLLIVWVTLPSVVFCRESAPPLLLSFNIIHESDAQDLASLDITVSATYFVEGNFARNFPDLVTTLSQSGTIGLYSALDLTQLSVDEVQEALRGSMQSIASATGQSPIWLRMPFLNEHESVLIAARDLGFLYDSSETERWVHQQLLEEFPISTNDTGRVIFSDDDMFSTYGLTDSMVLEILKENYMSRYQTGRPLVLVLNPEIIVKHAKVLNQFIEFVEVQGGRCLSFDQYLEGIRDDLTKKNIAVRIDLDFGSLDVKRTVANLLKAQVSDAFLMVPDKMAQVFITDDVQPPGSVETNFNRLIQGLTRSGIRVHASISTLHKNTVGGIYPSRVMEDGFGEKSKLWTSPSSPQIIENLQKLVAGLLDTYPIEGINLDGIAYPSLDYDYSDVALEKFAHDTGIAVDKTAAAVLLQQKYYNEWVQWRASQLREVVEAVALTISNAGRGILFSATLSGKSLTNFQSMEASGQDFRLLAEILDLIIISMPESDAAVFSKLISMGRFKMGNKFLFLTLSASAKTNHSKSEIDQFTEQLMSVRQGADGIVLSPYRVFFDHEAMESDRRDNLTHLLKVHLQPQKPITKLSETGLSTSVAEHTTVNKTGAPEEKERWGQVYLVILIGGALCAVIVIRLARRNIKDKTLVKEERDGVLDWQELAESIETNQLSGRLVNEVANHLAPYDQSTIIDYRMAFFLSMVDEAPEKIRSIDLNCIADDIPGGRIMVNSNLKKALAKRFLQVDDNRVTLSEKGIVELKSMKERGFGVEHWRFVESRLHEKLQIICPECDGENMRYWSSGEFTCTHCSRLVNPLDCKKITKISSDDVSL